MKYILFTILGLLALTGTANAVVISTTVPLAPGAGYVLMSTSTGKYEYVATSSLGVGGTPAGSTGQIQFNNNGAFGATSTFVISTSTGNVGIGTSTPVSMLDVAGSFISSGGSGDYNLSGSLTTLDNTLLNRYINGLDASTRLKLTVGDTNGDGALTREDIATNRSRILGTIPNNHLDIRRAEDILMGYAYVTSDLYQLTGRGAADINAWEDPKFITATIMGVGTSPTAPNATLQVRSNTFSQANGSVSATNTSPLIVGAATQFTTQFAVGDPIRIGTSTTIYTIQSIADNLNLTLTSNYTGSTGTFLSIYKDMSTLFAVDNGLGTRKLALTQYGNLGIGSTSPIAKLSVTGSGLTTGKAFEITNSTNAPKFTVLDNGNVGIMTPAPANALDVAGNIQLTGLAPTLLFKPTAWGASPMQFQAGVSADFGDLGNYGGFYLPSGRGFVVNQSDVPRFVVDSTNGNVGVGSSTPAEKLSVEGNGLFTGALTSIGQNLYSGGMINFYSDAGSAIVGNFGVNAEGNFRMYDTSSNKSANFDTNSLTDDRTYTLPDQTGTIALTSDIAIPDYSVKLNTSVSTQTFEKTTTPSPLTWDTEVFDTDTMHDGTNPTRITFTHAGKYMVVGAASVDGTEGSNGVSVKILLNGTTYIADEYMYMLVPSGAFGDQRTVRVSTIFEFSAGDYIELVGNLHDSDSSNSIFGTDTNLFTSFEAKKI